MVSNCFGISAIGAPVDIHHSVGKVDRHVQVMQRAYEAVESAVGNSLSS